MLKLKKFACIALTFFIITVSLTACGSGSYASDNSSKGSNYISGESASDKFSDILDADLAADDRKIIQTVTYSVQTKDFDSLISSIRTQTDSLGGYVEYSNFYGNDYDYSNNRRAKLTLRIPSGESESFCGYLESNANITYKEVSTDDVTLKYVDTASRISALESEKDALENMLKNAETTTDLLAIRQQLTDVISQLESYKSQLNTYDNLIDYVTIHVNIDEVHYLAATDSADIWSKISVNLKNNFANVGDLLIELFIFTLSAIPYLLLVAVPLAIILIITIFVSRKNRKKREAKRNIEKLQ